jgi:hypothetical protein
LAEHAHSHAPSHEHDHSHGHAPLASALHVRAPVPGRVTALGFSAGFRLAIAIVPVAVLWVMVALVMRGG